MNEKFALVNLNFNETAPVFKVTGLGDLPAVIEVTYLSKHLINKFDLFPKEGEIQSRKVLNMPSGKFNKPLKPNGPWKC